MLGFEKRIMQRNLPHVLHPRIRTKLGINKEQNGHLNLFSRLQPLFLKTKTLYLVEILGCFVWYHTVRRDSYDRLRSLVFRLEEC